MLELSPSNKILLNTVLSIAKVGSSKEEEINAVIPKKKSISLIDEFDEQYDLFFKELKVYISPSALNNESTNIIDDLSEDLDTLKDSLYLYLFRQLIMRIGIELLEDMMHPEVCPVIKISKGSRFNSMTPQKQSSIVNEIFVLPRGLLCMFQKRHSKNLGFMVSEFKNLFEQNDNLNNEVRQLKSLLSIEKPKDMRFLDKLNSVAKSLEDSNKKVEVKAVAEILGMKRTTLYSQMETPKIILDKVIGRFKFKNE